MNVLVVYNRYMNRGGEDEVCESEAALLEKNGCTVELVTETVRAPANLLAGAGQALDTVWSRKWYRKIQDVIKKSKPDVVHVHNCFPVMSPSIYYACHNENVPVVQTLHNYRLFCPAAIFFRDGHVCLECVEHGLSRSVRHACYRGSRLATGAVALMLASHRLLGTWDKKIDAYIALTEFARQTLISSGLAAGKVMVKPNYVSPDPGVGKGVGRYAIFIGRLSAEKGVRTLCNAWSRLKERVPLVIVGDGPLRAEMEEVVRTKGLKDVKFLGRVSRLEVLEAVKGASFLIFPSEWYESGPLTIIEAYACGVPVVASRGGAADELVHEEQTGLKFHAADASDLARSVEWAWTHREEMAAMGTRARREYEEKYTAERNYGLLIDIYRRACVNRGVGISKDLMSGMV